MRQTVNREIKAHSDETGRPKTFRDPMSELQQTGHLTAKIDGTYDRFSLTTGGQKRLIEQSKWMRELRGPCNNQ